MLFIPWQQRSWHSGVELKGIRRYLFVVLGTLCVVLAGVGIILPVLPTTPFLLLAAFFYARSSERFYNWLLTNRWFGEYIRNYREGRGLPLRHKLITIFLLWITILYAAWFAVSVVWIRLILIGIATAVTVHLARVKTYRPEIHSDSRQILDLDEEPEESADVYP